MRRSTSQASRSSSPGQKWYCLRTPTVSPRHSPRVVPERRLRALVTVSHDHAVTTRNPSTDVASVVLVVLTEDLLERRLLVDHDEHVEGNQDDGRPDDQLPRPKHSAGSEDYGDVGDVHRVAEDPVRTTADDEARWIDRSECPSPFVSESHENAFKEQPTARHDQRCA